MQDIAGSKEAVRLLKNHDTFLMELRLGMEKDQEQLRTDIDDKIQLSQIIFKAVAELQKKKDYINSLEGELQQYRLMEKDYETLRVRHQEELHRSEDLATVSAHFDPGSGGSARKRQGERGGDQPAH